MPKCNICGLNDNIHFHWSPSDMEKQASSLRHLLIDINKTIMRLEDELEEAKKTRDDLGKRWHALPKEIKKNAI